MKQNTNPQIEKAELEASLARLDIRELEERMEISPLLVDTGTKDQDMSNICCVCKIPDPFDPNGNLPYPMDLGSTGPTNPDGIW